MPIEVEKKRAKLRQKSLSLYGNETKKLHETLSEISAWCERGDIKLDNYGTGDVLERFEKKIAKLLGFPAARFMPSGVMAQLTALRIWSDRAACNQFGMHPTSHLEIHEEQAYAHLHGLKSTLIGPEKSPLLAEHFDAVEETLASLLVELPIREAGGQLPSWEELESLKQSTQQKGVRLHLDGARLWECKSFYQREFSEICRGFDSAYVSFYKGIGALPGAMLLGPKDFIEDAKIWQRRAGGTLQTQAVNVASASLKFDQSLEMLPVYFEHTQRLVNTIGDLPGIQILPSIPQTNMIHIYLPFSADIATAARDGVAEKTEIWMFGRAAPTDDPNTSYFELYVGDVIASLSEEKIRQAFACLFDLGKEMAKRHK
jgi:threonine aldolase